MNVIEGSIGKSSVTVSLHGATVTSWLVDGVEQLFLSKHATLDGSKAIRGGIPLVFPIFGTVASSTLPQHGFARISPWKHIASTQQANSFHLEFTLSPEDVLGALQEKWSHPFLLTYRVILTRDTLSTTLTIENTGQQSFEFNALFHTYFLVSDVRAVCVRGLTGFYFEDRDGSKGVDSEKAVGFTKEVDRVYRGVGHEVIEIEEGGKVCMTITKEDASDVVVWNPYVHKSKTMSDFGDDEYLQMVGEVSSMKSVAPGESIVMSQMMQSAIKSNL